MPELPEVETIMRGMMQSLSGHCINSVTVGQKKLRKPFPSGLAEQLQGATILGFARRAKYICMFLSNFKTLLLHLGMSGRVILKKVPVTEMMPHEHLSFDTQEGTHFGLVDPRRFGLVDIVQTGFEKEHPLLSSLGIEPFDEGFDADYLRGHLISHRSPIKTVLLKQDIIAGLGNIYASESLFLAKISPFKKASDVTEEELERLVGSIRDVLLQAIKAGGSSLKDFVKTDGSMGYFQTQWKVYNCAGKACKTCGTQIEKATLLGRSTFYCRVCQG